MKNNIFLAAGILAIFLIGAGILASGRNSKNQNSFSSANVRGNEQMQEQINQIANEDQARYLDYSQENLSESKARGRRLLFFHASWCPTCNALDKELKTKIDKLAKDVTILKTDYDSEKLLKQKYKVTVQHTLVQIDEENNEIKKWIGGGIDVINQQLI